MADKSMFEQLRKGVADAISDIREKVVEEGYFGRAVTDKGQGIGWPEPKDEMERGFASSVHHYEKGGIGWPEAREAQEPKVPEADRDKGMDR
ncbi:MAG TPA: hypothetical protein VHZ07_20910 [Bryobacteraceae bacterium]|jgi:hypothetical protein|nr:hypothetical protein [Bryobacteraceae bacterium]